MKLLKVIPLVLSIIPIGCATTPEQIPEVSPEQMQSINQLDTRLKSAEVNEVGVLAPTGYKNAKESLTKAQAAVKTQGGARASELASQGIQQLSVAETNAQTSRDIMFEVLEARQRAKKAGAPNLFANKLNDLDKQLQEAAKLIETGKLEAAKIKRPELLTEYSKLELASLKEGTLQVAEAAIARAKENKANKYAPKTFTKAQEELKVALSILDVNRAQQDKADTHAKRARDLAERSNYIAELVKEFDRRDYKQEDIILWYQSELSKISEPLGVNLSFTQDNRSIVQGLQNQVASLVQQKLTNQQTIAERESTIRELRQKTQADLAALEEEHKEQIALLDSKQAEQQRRDREVQQRFEYVQSIFNDMEAKVYRERDNVLISAQGFYFPPGKSEIQSSNFGLLNKAILAIDQFKGAKIQISGHTDSTGDAKYNMALSKQRAENVATFLNSVGHISNDRITVKGFGKEKPIASNDTPEGRAQNRRIEILIVNEPTS